MLDNIDNVILTQDQEPQNFNQDFNSEHETENKKDEVNKMEVDRKLENKKEESKKVEHKKEDSKIKGHEKDEYSKKNEEKSEKELEKKKDNLKENLRENINDSGIEEIILLKQSIEEKDEVIENLKNEIENYKESLLRMKADFDNFKKRLIKEKEDFVKYSLIKFIEDLLPIIDNFSRAIISYKGDLNDPFFEGIKLIEKSFEDLLTKKYSCESFGAPGDKFDPNLHEALSMIEDEDKDGIYIKEVYQKGYKIDDKIIRTAKVVAVKGKKNENK